MQVGCPPVNPPPTSDLPQYPRLDKKRTRWELTVEGPQVGMTLLDFTVKRIKWMTPAKLDELLDEQQLSVVGIDQVAGVNNFSSFLLFYERPYHARGCSQLHTTARAPGAALYLELLGADVWML